MPIGVRLVEHATHSSVTLAVLRGNCNEIYAELVVPQSDLTRLEPRTNQHRPKSAFVVIHFVIVDLYF